MSKSMASLILLIAILLITTVARADSIVKYEVESLFPMYFYEGAHLAVGVRMNDWRIRASCIDGGNYDYEPNNKSFERNLGRGCGLFFGCFFHSNWHANIYVENQNYIVRNRDNNKNHTFEVINTSIL